MFMKYKPVKFGYKFWVLASSQGYPFHLIFYTGKDMTRNGRPLGQFVINYLLDVNLQENYHSLSFDNFFSSYLLFTELLEKEIAATSTMRSNRIPKNPLLCESEMKKKERGTVDFA